MHCVVLVFMLIVFRLILWHHGARRYTMFVRYSLERWRRWIYAGLASQRLSFAQRIYVISSVVYIHPEREGERQTIVHSIVYIALCGESETLR